MKIMNCHQFIGLLIAFDCEFQEMQELEKELKALYQEQKEAVQSEVSTTKAAIATRYVVSVSKVF